MTTTSFAELTSRHRSRHLGTPRSPFSCVMQTRDRKVRRAASGVMTLGGGDRLDLSRIERQSFFELSAPERC